MTNSIEILSGLKVEKDFFIGIDSDGCVFDTMELKHKECFCPAFIKYFNLQAVSKYARETWDFVNLYSSTRGCNRFLAVLRSLDLLAERHEVQARGIKIFRFAGLREWAAAESKLGNPALQEKVSATSDPDLTLALAWSLEVNSRVKDMFRNVSPFPYAAECLDLIKEKADAIVISQTPLEALEKEWKDSRLDGYVKMITGQEMGKKSEHLKYAAGGKYKDNSVLMIGDAPGDYQAAKANQALFFPVNPGKEQDSWERLYKEALGKFFDGSYRGYYQDMLLHEFEALLPENPPWA